MNLAQALHTAARRYCNERHEHWAVRYSELARDGRDRDGYNYTPEALRIFPRYNVLNSIRIELERLNPTDLGNLDEVRNYIILAGEVTDDDFTRKPLSQIDADAMADEREAFCSFVSDLSEAELQSIEPLPYQRVLSSPESKTVWTQLRERWQITDGYWYPLAECALSDIVAFQDRYFHESISSISLSNLLSSRGITRAWELREYGPEYEQDVSLFNPHYNGAEGYWSSGDLEWVVYASHESSITVGGWLLQEIKAQWPQWEQRIWETPFF